MTHIYHPCPNYLVLILNMSQMLNAQMLAKQLLIPILKQQLGANKQGCTCAVNGTSLPAVLILQQLPVT